MRATPFICCAALCGLLCGAPAIAAPHRPTSDDDIVATLPGGAARDRAADEWRRNAGRLASMDATELTGLARLDVERARREGDPRYLGHALALLSRWKDPARDPVDVIVLQATIHQSLHQFELALRELDSALAREPRNAQARLTRATVLQVTGRLAVAARDCSALAQGGQGLVAVTCSAGVSSLTGHGRPAYVMLDFTIRSAGAQDSGVLAWSRTVLAEIAERNGDDAAAAAQYRAALALDPRDRYLRAAFADFLLDHGDPGAARALTADAWTDDNLLLRQALALAGLASPERAAAIAALADRYAAARERGDSVHLREEARFALHLQHDPRRAIELAIANWAIQKEPADARILLEAALAAGDREHEQVARAWFRQAGVADHYLQHVVAGSSRAAVGAAS